MKVINKETGEIGYLYANKNENYNVLDENDKVLAVYETLETVVGEWQDYEEPKEPEYYWYIGYKNDISGFADNQVTATRKEIGNCFETEEEAKDALRKLKAMAKLKEFGFRFIDWELDMKTVADGKIWFDVGINTEWDAERLLELKPEVKESLDILFGGEE